KEWSKAAGLTRGEAHKHLTIEFGTACCNAANELIQAGKTKEALPWYDDAIAALEELRREHPSDARTAEVLADSHTRRAMAQYSLGNFNRSKRDWDRAIELKGDDNPLWRLARADTSARLGQHAEAEADFSSQLSARPGQPSPGQFHRHRRDGHLR